jgi:PAS domain S-box-containing protein
MLVPGKRWLNDTEAFQLLLDNVRDHALFVLSTDGTIQTWNVGVERVLGYSEKDFVGQPFSVLFPPEDIAAGQPTAEMQTAVANGRAEDERWHVRGSGQRFWASGVLTALRDDVGDLRGFAKIMRDMTTRKLAEEERKQLLLREQHARAEAEESNRVRDYFLATVSHELRTPLNAIVGWTKLLQSGNLSSDATAQALATIDRNAQMQATLINDLLEVPKLLSGNVALAFEPLDIGVLVRQVVESVMPEAHAKGVRLESRLHGAVASVAGDPPRLQQVLWNLVGNAVKFTPPGGTVVVDVASSDGMVVLTVADTGIGIDAEFLPYVFEPFRQAEQGMARKHGGLGLGLAIAKHLVAKHGGTIAVDSPGIGGGATFTVKLPVTSVTQIDEPVPAPIETKLSLAGIRVLVVDDEADSRLVATTALDLSGATTQGASSTEDALGQVASFEPTVIVCDLGMPREDGFRFITKLRELPESNGGRTPAIALTAHTSPQDRLRALTAGFQMHLPKPVDLEALVAAVAALSGRASD